MNGFIEDISEQLNKLELGETYDYVQINKELEVIRLR